MAPRNSSIPSNQVCIQDGVTGCFSVGAMVSDCLVSNMHDGLHNINWYQVCIRHIIAWRHVFQLVL